MVCLNRHMMGNQLLCYNRTMKTTASEIEQIRDMLSMLTEPALQETRDFIQYLLEKQKKRKAFVDRVLKAEKETPVRYKSVDDAVKAVFDEVGD